MLKLIIYNIQLSMTLLNCSISDFRLSKPEVSMSLSMISRMGCLSSVLPTMLFILKMSGSTSSLWARCSITCSMAAWPCVLPGARRYVLLGLSVSTALGEMAQVLLRHECSIT